MVAIRLFVVFLTVQSVCLGAAVSTRRAPKDAAPDKEKIEVRNNAVSLLADLLGDEKNVSKILIIKHNSAELGRLIKAISETAGEGEKQLEDLAKNDTTLNLRALQLPPGEVATRAAVSKTKEHELLLTSGEKFEFNLLLTQTEALNYGSHLAKIAAENSSSPAETREFHALDVKLNDLFQQVVARMRALPAK